MSALDLPEKVRLLRERFDGSFALAPPPPPPGRVPLLAIRVGETPLAIRIADLAAVTVNRRVVPLPGAVSQLAGLMGLRGKFVVVYSLAALLESKRSGGPEPWVAQCAKDPTVGLSFSEFSGHLEAEPANLGRAGSPADASGLVREFLEEGPAIRGVLDLSAVLAVIAGLARPVERREG